MPTAIKHHGGTIGAILLKHRTAPIVRLCGDVGYRPSSLWPMGTYTWDMGPRDVIVSLVVMVYFKLCIEIFSPELLYFPLQSYYHS